MAKRYYLASEQIKDVARGYGSCIASDRITVDGQRVGLMYRESPVNPLDSGWRFVAGDENEDYMADNANHDVYDVNTIANVDPAIVEFLHEPVGACFERAFGGEFRPR